MRVSFLPELATALETLGVPLSPEEIPLRGPAGRAPGGKFHIPHKGLTQCTKKALDPERYELTAATNPLDLCISCYGHEGYERARVTVPLDWAPVCNGLLEVWNAHRGRMPSSQARATSPAQLLADVARGPRPANASKSFVDWLDAQRVHADVATADLGPFPRASDDPLDEFAAKVMAERHARAPRKSSLFAQTVHDMRGQALGDDGQWTATAADVLAIAAEVAPEPGQRPLEAIGDFVQRATAQAARSLRSDLAETRKELAELQQSRRRVYYRLGTDRPFLGAGAALSGNRYADVFAAAFPADLLHLVEKYTTDLGPDDTPGLVELLLSMRSDAPKEFDNDVASAALTARAACA